IDHGGHDLRRVAPSLEGWQHGVADLDDAIDGRTETASAANQHGRIGGACNDYAVEPVPADVIWICTLEALEEPRQRVRRLVRRPVRRNRRAEQPPEVAPIPDLRGQAQPSTRPVASAA